MATVVATVILFYLANGKPTKLIGLILIWTVLQSFLAYTGFYYDNLRFPPPVTLIIAPTLALIIYGLTGDRRKWFIKNRNIKISTLLHSVRIPVELILFFIYKDALVPQLMTFEGRNYDILAGITALIMYLLLRKGKANKRIMLLWNAVSLALVTFILINASLSIESPFQLFAFDQPNRAVTMFPYILLPSVIVAIVIYTHISDIMYLCSKEDNIL